MKEQITYSTESSEPGSVNCRRRYLLINDFEGSSVWEVDMGPLDTGEQSQPSKAWVLHRTKGKGKFKDDYQAAHHLNL